jgi:predicted GIY-YIG superfamily endonuclease
MRYEHKSRDGQLFIIYALVCPRTLQVRYVGQTSTPLSQRTHNHTAHHHQGAMRDWLESLLPEHPAVLILEEGINRAIRLKSGWRRENKGGGQTRAARVCLWLSTVRETVWQKRFRRTLYNEMLLESSEVAALLRNPPLPWEM